VIPPPTSDAGAIAPLALLRRPCTLNDGPQYAGPDAPGYRQELVESKQRGVRIAESHWEQLACVVELSGQLALIDICGVAESCPTGLSTKSHRASGLSNPRPVIKATGKDATEFISFERN
jgi:hypothetical protein